MKKMRTFAICCLLSSLSILLFGSADCFRTPLLLSSRPAEFRNVRRKKEAPQSNFALQMVVTPVGPFCPFRSSAAVELEPRMEALSADGPDFAAEMSRVQLEINMGRRPDPDLLFRVSDRIVNSVDKWTILMARLRLSPDFQTREYAKLTEAHLENHGMSIDGIAAMMKWQAGCMVALAQNAPPPLPPAEVDLEKMMNLNNSKDKLSISAMIEKLPYSAATPFKGKDVFNSPVVVNEYDSLCRDHMNLIEFGGKYETFDPLGKLIFLDEIEKLHDRWDVFFKRFSLLGAINEEYISQCDEFLASMGMNEEQYRELLVKCHKKMRNEAEDERNQI